MASQKTSFVFGHQKKVLIKLGIKVEQIPIFCPHYDRLTDAQLDQRHADAARQMGQQSLAEVGRHREGRVDTGEPINLQSVSVASLSDDLRKAGYVLANFGYFKKNPDDNVAFVQLAFFRDTKEYPIRAETRKELDVLLKALWSKCHIWSNPDNSITVNCNIKQDGTPKIQLGVKDEMIGIVQ